MDFQRELSALLENVEIHHILHTPNFIEGTEVITLEHVTIDRTAEIDKWSWSDCYNPHEVAHSMATSAGLSQRTKDQINKQLLLDPWLTAAFLKLSLRLLRYWNIELNEQGRMRQKIYKAMEVRTVLHDKDVAKILRIRKSVIHDAYRALFITLTPVHDRALSLVENETPEEHVGCGTRSEQVSAARDLYREMLLRKAAIEQNQQLIIAKEIGLENNNSIADIDSGCAGFNWGGHGGDGPLECLCMETSWENSAAGVDLSVRELKELFVEQFMEHFPGNWVHLGSSLCTATRTRACESADGYPDLVAMPIEAGPELESLVRM